MKVKQDPNIQLKYDEGVRELEFNINQFILDDWIQSKDFPTTINIDPDNIDEQVRQITNTFNKMLGNEYDYSGTIAVASHKTKPHMKAILMFEYQALWLGRDFDRNWWSDRGDEYLGSNRNTSKDDTASVVLLRKREYNLEAGNALLQAPEGFDELNTENYSFGEITSGLSGWFGQDAYTKLLCHVVWINTDKEIEKSNLGDLITNKDLSVTEHELTRTLNVR